MTSPPVHIAAPAALYNGGREGKPTAAALLELFPIPTTPRFQAPKSFSTTRNPALWRNPEHSDSTTS